MSPFASALAQWATVATNGLLDLDPIARARLERLDGLSIELHTGPSSDAFVVEFSRGRLAIRPGDGAVPNVRVSGNPAAMLEALASGNFGAGRLTIEGDEATLQEFADILRTLRPDIETPLAGLIGEPAAQNLVGLVELGLEAFGRLAREAGLEAGKLVRASTTRRFLGREEFERFASRRHSAALAIDRIRARIEVLEADDEAEAP